MSTHPRYYKRLTMQMKYILTASLAAILIIGCKTTSSGDIPKGAFVYTSYDSSGVEIARGWLTIVTSDSSALSGEWHVKGVDGAERIGPQIGDGNLIGGLSNDRAWVELNPKVRNNNLQLNGTLDRSQFTGQWTWISYNGIANQGTFKAIRK